MDEAILKRAIEPFFSTKGIGKGTGLGLSMVHGLVAQLGGAMAISSKPGLGTRVDLWLRLADEPAEVGRHDPQRPLIAATGTALLVDDEDLVRASTAEMLNDLGYAVIEAASAEDALRLVAKGLEPDLLVTDHLMPGMDGVELAELLKSEGLANHIVAATAYRSELERERTAAAGFAAHLVKPIERTTLEKLLTQLH